MTGETIRYFTFSSDDESATIGLGKISRVIDSVLGVGVGEITPDEAEFYVGAFVTKRLAGTIGRQCVGAGRICLEDREASINALAVLPDYCSTGIGSQLLSKLEEIAQARSLPPVIEGPAPQVSEFFEKHGYVEAESDPVEQIPRMTKL